MQIKITWPAYLGAAIVNEVKRRITLRPKAALASQSVRELLQNRTPTRAGRIYRVSRTATCRDAVRVMTDHGVDAVVVEDTGAAPSAFTSPMAGMPLGLVTHSSVLKAALHTDLPLSQLQAVAAMTPIESSAYVLPDNTVQDTLAILAACQQQHAPVFTARPRVPTSSSVRSVRGGTEAVVHPMGTRVGQDKPGELLAVVGLQELLGLTAALRDERAQQWSALGRPVDRVGELH